MKEGGLGTGKSFHQNNLTSGFESFESRVKVSRFYPLATQKNTSCPPPKDANQNLLKKKKSTCGKLCIHGCSFIQGSNSCCDPEDQMMR